MPGKLWSSLLMSPVVRVVAPVATFLAICVFILKERFQLGSTWDEISVVISLIGIPTVIIQFSWHLTAVHRQMWNDLPHQWVSVLEKEKLIDIKFETYVRRNAVPRCRWDEMAEQIGRPILKQTFPYKATGILKKSFAHVLKLQETEFYDRGWNRLPESASKGKKVWEVAVFDWKQTFRVPFDNKAKLTVGDVLRPLYVGTSKLLQEPVMGDVLRRGRFDYYYPFPTGWDGSGHPRPAPMAVKWLKGSGDSRVPATVLRGKIQETDALRNVRAGQEGDDPDTKVFSIPYIKLREEEIAASFGADLNAQQCKLVEEELLEAWVPEEQYMRAALRPQNGCQDFSVELGLKYRLCIGRRSSQPRELYRFEMPLFTPVILQKVHFELGESVKEKWETDIYSSWCLFLPEIEPKEEQGQTGDGRTYVKMTWGDGPGRPVLAGHGFAFLWRARNPRT